VLGSGRRDLTSGTTVAPELDRSDALQQDVGPGPNLPPPAPEAGERKGGGRFVPVASTRTKILASYVVLLALSAIVATFAFRESLLIRLEDQVHDELRQEVFELDRLLTDGQDPATGKPFATLGALFDVYFARNVPGRDEAMLAFVDGELYRSSTLARFPLDRLPGENLSDWQVLASSSPGRPGSATGTFNTERGQAFYRATRIHFHGETGAFVVTILPAGEREEIADLQALGVAGAFGLLLVASILAWLVAGRVLRPVRQLTETARSISQSDLTQRIPERGTGEAAEMAHSFNSMLDRLETVFQRQREFVQDASHELRDPLTICRGHLELLSDDPEERRLTIALVTDELERMGRIVDDLQLLAESEYPDFLRREWIDGALFAHELAAKASALAGREWKLDTATEAVFFGDRQRLTEAVMNLAHNAVQHTDRDDTIALGVTVTDHEARLWVRDTGLGIAVADQEKIFERFTRGSDAHRRYRGGGLGLAIVKIIAEAHDGRVELDTRLGQGSTFTIVVPREPVEGGATWPGS
jgi:signal transduction histidine kinase